MQYAHTANAPARFEALDSWRGIIACIIAICHLNLYGHFYGLPIFRNAYLFVDFFFVLSGFVISFAYLDKVLDGAGVASFVGRRFARLWPMHVIMLAAFVFTEFAKLFLLHNHGLSSESLAFHDHNTLSSIVANIFLVHSLGLYSDYTWNIPSWAVSVEFYTYIVFAIMILAASRGAAPRRTLTSLMCATAILCGFVIIRFSPKGIDTDVDYGIFRCLLDFSIGYLAYAVWMRTAARWQQKAPRPFIFSAMEIISVALLFYFVWRFANTSFAILSPLISAITIYVFACQAGVLSQGLRGEYMQTLGRHSYCIFIIHVFLIVNLLNRPIYFIEKFTGVSLTRIVPPAEATNGVAAGKMILLFNQWQADALALAYIVTVVVLAGVSYRYIEVPCFRFLSRKISLWIGRARADNVTNTPAGAW